VAVAFQTAAVFALVAAGTVAIGLRFWNWSARVVERIRARPQTVSAFLPAPSLIWHELVSWMGSVAPSSPRDMTRLKLRLVRAGFRAPGALRTFQGARVCGTLVLTAAALAAGWRLYLPTDRFVMLVGAAAVTGWQAPMQYVMLRVRRRKHAIEKGLPNALDLMVVCVEAGLGLDQATLQVAKELHAAHPEICEEFTIMNLEMRAGKRRTEALHNLAERTAVDDLKKLVAVLVQTDRFGTSIAQSLRGHSDYMRTMARQRAEERAAKLAVKLVFPIFFCVLPSLFVVTVGPVMTKLVRDLFPMIENM
jgi:tight adherence protein C